MTFDNSIIENIDELQFIENEKYNKFVSTLTQSRSSSTNVNDSEICGCKGIRSCKVCTHSERVVNIKLSDNNEKKYEDYCFYRFDIRLQKAIFDPLLNYNASLNDIMTMMPHSINNDAIDMVGLLLTRDFISVDEEEYLIKEIDSRPWVLSQSGRRKQDYGPKVNFKKQKVKLESFEGLPMYADGFLKKLIPILNEPFNGKSFQLVEMCNLEYSNNRHSCIEMHKDDRWIWGERIVSINLLGETVMSFEDETTKRVVFVYLPRRSMLCMTNEARNLYAHGIFAHHITDRRIAITVREAADTFAEGGIYYEQYGKELMQRAKMRI